MNVTSRVDGLLAAAEDRIASLRADLSTTVHVSTTGRITHDVRVAHTRARRVGVDRGVSLSLNAPVYSSDGGLHTFSWAKE